MQSHGINSILLNIVIYFLATPNWITENDHFLIQMDFPQEFDQRVEFIKFANVNELVFNVLELKVGMVADDSLEFFGMEHFV